MAELAPPDVLELWRNPDLLIEKASEHYREDLDYHNFEWHVANTYKVALDKIELCRANNIEVDEDVVLAAVLWHDAKFWQKPGVDHEFASKEKYSAAIAAEELLALGMPESKVAHVVACIESTEKGVECQSAEARIVRQADMANLTSPVTFINGTLRLYRESKRLAGEPIRLIPNRQDLQRFIAISHEVLSTYVAEDVSLGEFDNEPNGQCKFNVAAERTVRWLLDTGFLMRLISESSKEPIGL